MMKLVKCPACNETYNLDLTKFGGKKIKCKKCQGVIAVPTAALAQDGFEIVEESPPHAPAPRMPAVPAHLSAGAPPSILQRNRMSSQRSAVNIALLKRSESSRDEIRQAFLDVNGTEEARNAPIEALREQISQGEASISAPTEKIIWLKDVLARALASDPKNVRANLTTSANTLKSFFNVGQPLSKEGDEDAFSYALTILGGPIREIPPKKGPNDYSFLDGFTGIATEEENKRVVVERAIKIDTIKAAIEMAAKLNREQSEAGSIQRKKLEQQIRTILSSHKTKLDQAMAHIASGNYSAAILILDDMKETAPVDMIDNVLVALSQCTYLSGNTSNAARQIQDAICFGASAPLDMDEGYNDLWAKASSGLPPT